MAIAGTISAFSSEGRGAMQMPPVSERMMKNKIFGIHPVLDESKRQLFFVKGNTEATLQVKSTEENLCNSK